MKKHVERRADSTPLIVEIIGLAGTGKSTLTRELCRRNEEVVLGDYLLIRNVRHMPYMVKHGFLTSPIFLRQLRNGRGFTWREILKVMYLNGWSRVLEQQSTLDQRVTILDQGPIYELATLYGFGPERLHSHAYTEWWSSMYKQWAHTLDRVIWLDAPEEVLIDRIRTRGKWHPVKESSDREMRDYLARYRSAHEHVMAELAATHGVSPLRFDTGSQSSEELVAHVLNAISQEDSKLLRSSTQVHFEEVTS